MKRLDYTGFREDAFDTWTPEMAYWLGFFAADGSVPANSNYINITLNTKDREHLVKFKEFLGLQDVFLGETYTTVRGKRYTQSRLSFTSAYVKQRLISLGIVPRKSSLDIDFTRYVPPEYLTSFLLGYFDGDGSYSGMTSENMNLGIIYCGSYTFIESVRDYFVHEHSFSYVSTYSTEEGMCYLKWSRRKDVLLFAELHLKTLGDLPLERKLQSAVAIITGDAYDSCLDCGNSITKGTRTNLCQPCSSRGRRRVNRPDKEELKELLRTQGYSALGRKYGVSDNAVRKWAKNYGLLT